MSSEIGFRGPLGERNVPRVTAIGIGEADTPGVGVLILEARGKRFSFALTAEMCRDLGRKLVATADMLPPADGTTPSVKKTGPVGPSAN